MTKTVSVEGSVDGSIADIGAIDGSIDDIGGLVGLAAMQQAVRLTGTTVK